jgi:hypothetical protein
MQRPRCGAHHAAPELPGEVSTAAAFSFVHHSPGVINALRAGVLEAGTRPRPAPLVTAGCSRGYQNIRYRSIVMLKDWVTCWPLKSVSRMVRVKVPAVVGVPTSSL